MLVSPLAFIINLQRHQTHFDRKFRILARVNLLEINLQNFVKGIPKGTSGSKRVNNITRVT